MFNCLADLAAKTLVPPVVGLPIRPFTYIKIITALISKTYPVLANYCVTALKNLLAKLEPHNHRFPHNHR